MRPYFREWRVAHAMTQAELARKLGVTPSYICRLETGVHPYTKNILEGVAGEYNMRVGELYFHPGDPYADLIVLIDRLPLKKVPIAMRYIAALTKVKPHDS